MAKELKRRDLSGIYIFDTFPGESHRRPTCIEDCQPVTLLADACGVTRHKEEENNELH